MATITAAAGGGNWTTGGTWVGGSAPTAADDAVLANTSGNVVVTSGAACRSLNCTGYTGTLSGSQALTIGDASAGAGNVALKLVAGMTLTHTGQVVFTSTSGTQQTIATGGKTIGVGGTLANGAGSSYILSDDLTCSGTVIITHGAWDFNNRNVTAFGIQTNGTNTRSIILGTGTMTLNDSAGWFAASTGLTLNVTGSTIRLTRLTGNQQFAGGGLTYNNVEVELGGIGTLTFTGSSTFARLYNTGTGSRTIAFTAGTTTTLTPASNAFFSSAAGSIVELRSTTIGTAWNLSMASGTLACQYIALKDSAAAGGATFNATNSYDISGNSGWNITAPGGGGGTTAFMSAGSSRIGVRES
jgi:hypothetical protein